MSKLSERLKEYMDERGFHQLALERETGIRHTNVSDYLSGKHLPSYAHLLALAELFDCSIDYLLGLTELPSEEKLLPALPFDKRLRALLNECGISQERLKRELPVSASVLYKWLSGKSQPSAESLIRLANYLDFSVDYLIGRIR